MLGFKAMGPVRLPNTCSRRCGARLLAPIAPCWRRSGAVVLPLNPAQNVRLYAAGKRGRPRKDEGSPSSAPNPEPEEDQDDGEDAAAVKSKKGRKSRKAKAQEEARDLLESQQVNIEVLEEFKARAVAEEQAKRALMADAGEDDPRRLNFHRSLLAASQRGLTDECARIIQSMVDAGLPPGPRAVHVWAYSHIQVGDGPEARTVAEQARQDYGITWIPETYVALMHGALNCTRGGPDLMSALELWVVQQDGGEAANPQLGFTFLAKELFRLRYSALAMQVVSEGYAAGLKPDEKLAALVIEQLCKQGLMAEARAEMQRLLDAEVPVGPDHYDTIVRLDAAQGNLQAARALLQTFYDDPRFSPPRTSTYTALLKGLVSSLRSRPSPELMDGILPPGEGDPAGAAAGPEGGKVDLDSDQLDALTIALRDEMVARGLRPGRETYAAMVEAFAAVGDLDGALANYETMTRAKGSPALLRRKYLGRLVVSLLTSDRPIDALRLLRDSAATPSYSNALACVSLPASASLPVAGPEGGGRSALTVWLPTHHDVMRQRRGQRSSVMAFMRDADMSSRREVDGVVLGLGGCVVTEDGLFVPPTKMTLAELRVELSANGVDISGLASGGRKELTKLVKERRSKLPSGILDMQSQLEGLVTAREAEREVAEAAARGEAGPGEAVEEEYDDDDSDTEDTLDANIQDILADTGTFEGGESIEDSATFKAAAGGRLLMRGMDEGEEGEEVEDDEDEEDDDDDMEESFGDDPDAATAAAGGARKRRRSRRRRGRGDEDDEEDDEDDDEEALLGLEDGGAPPLSDGLGPAEGVMGPEDLDWDMDRAGPDDEDDNAILDQILNMSVFDSSRYNETAGMPVAMRLLELWVAVGCSPTPADLMALYDAATIEEHPRCSADLSEQLPVLMQDGRVSREQLTEMLVTLADVCLRPGAPDADAADRVVTVMEDNKLQVPADVYSALEAALNGRSRLRDSVLGRGAAGAEEDLEGSGLSLEDEDEAAIQPLAGALGPGREEEGEAEEDEEEEAEEGAEAAEAEEGEDEDEEVFGEYEEDPGQLEEERQELERLFQKDGEEDDAWLDELEGQTADVAEVRAAAEAEAAQTVVAQAVTATLEAVRARTPQGAALLAQRLSAIERTPMPEPAEPQPAGAAAAGLVAAGATSVVPYGGGGGDGRAGVAEGDAEADALDAELAELGAEAEWEAMSLGEMPPGVLAEAAEATAAEMEAAGMLSDEDRVTLRRMQAKAQLLADLHALSDAAAAAHPGGVMAADAEVAAALARLQQAEEEAAAASSLITAALVAADGPVPVAVAEVDAAAGGEEEEEGAEAIAFEDPFAEEAEEAEEGEEEPGRLRAALFEPGVDDGVLTGVEAEALEQAVAEAAALLREEEEAAAEEEEGQQGRPQEGAGAEDGGPSLNWELGRVDVEQQSRLLQQLLQAADAQGEELNEEQKKLYDLLEAGDTAALEELVGPEAMAWFAEDMKRLAEEEGVALEEAEEDYVPELPLGWRLKDGFMKRFAAVLRDRAVIAAERGISGPAVDNPEGATLDVLMAMADGYRLRGEEGAEEQRRAWAATREGEEGGDGEWDKEEEEDPVLAGLRQEALEAVARLEAAEPGDAEAAEEAEAAVGALLKRLQEVYGEGWADELGLGEGLGEEAEEGEEEEWELGEEEAKIPAAVPPEAAAELLAALNGLRPGTGPVFVAEDGEEAEGARQAAARAATVVAVEEEEEEEEEEAPPPPPPSRSAGGRGRGRGGSGAGRGRRSTR